VVLRALEGNPQLIRFTAVRAQRSAEYLSARLKPIPDVRASIGWRHYGDTGDNAVRLGIAIPLPVWDRNRGGVIEAGEQLAKTDAERAAARAALTLVLGRAYDTLAGSLREVEILRTTALPNVRSAVTATEDGYAQGRFTLLEVLDVQAAAAQAALREADALATFHNALATIEGLTGAPLAIGRRAAK
jgi:cobalt-zinc-cadmium efflux system outer membrane protein